MRTQKWKTIILRDSTLRRVRTSLRLVLRKAINTELDNLNYLRDLYRKKRLSGKLVPSQEKRESTLIKKSNILLQSLTNSILKCGSGAICKSIEENKLSPDLVTLGEDMVWNPLYKRWYCIKCYNSYYRTDAQKQELLDLRKQKEEEEKAFEDWLSKQLKQE